MNKKIENLYLILFSFIPVSIILGSAVSLINIFFISIVFLLFSIRLISKELLKDPTIRLMIFLLFYLIFNSFIALDFETSVGRNFGFIRFILLFLAINYFFAYSIKQESIYKIWFLIIFFVVIDSYIEFFAGKNI